MMKIFLISPVRGAGKREREKIRKYVTELEDQGHAVHWPERDTDQNDKIGLRICTDNRKAIREADEVHIWWKWKEKKWWERLLGWLLWWLPWWKKEKKSAGSLFDFGMAFALGKKIVLANLEEVQPTPKKSFNNVLRALYEEYLDALAEKITNKGG